MPFELHPDVPPEGLDRDDSGHVYSTHVREHITRLAAEAGIRLNMPDFLPNTRLALEVTEYAKEKGQVDKIIRPLFEAYYADNKNIGDPAVVADVCEQAGLDRKGVMAVMADRRYSHQLDHEIADAESMGIEMTPSARVCKKLLRGTKPYEIFEEAVNECVRHEC